MTRTRVSVFVIAAIVLAAVTATMLASRSDVNAQATVEAPYAGTYTATSLGSVPGVPPSYGGLTLLAGDSDTLLIGGEANDPTGALYSIGVVRDADNHITGFSGSASVFADAAFNDGGIVYGPGDVLFLARWPENEIGQTKPGSAVTDKIIDLDPLGVTVSVSTVAFVPSGFPGAGQLKLAVYDDGNWYSAAFSPDGSGTYDITSATLETNLGAGGPEGVAFVPPGSPIFPPNSILLAEYDNDVVATYQLDANGDPIPATRDEFITGLTGAEGAFIDPLTGDFLFSTFGGPDEVIVVQGFVPPGGAPTPTPTPEPTAAPTATPSATPTPTPAPAALPPTGSEPAGDIGIPRTAWLPSIVIGGGLLLAGWWLLVRRRQLLRKP
jgi:hypothetical protein